MHEQTREIHWQVRSFEDADLQRASDLRKLFQDGSERRSIDPGYYRWKILTNPAGTGLFHVADDNGRVVGITTITPKRLCMRGKQVLGAEIGDTFTHPDYQRQGMFSSLVNLTRERALALGLRFIYGTPNEQSLPGYEKKLNFLQIPSARVFNYVRPLKMNPVLSVRLGRATLARLLAPAMAVAFHTVYRFRPPKMKGTNISLASEFPRDVAELWEKLANKHDWILMRDQEYLNWRFVSNPDEYAIWIASKDGKTSGYLVTRQGRFGTLKVGYLADFLVDEDFPEIFNDLLFFAASSLQHADMDMLAAWAVQSSLYENVLSRSGFFRFKPVPIICHKNELGQEFVQGDDRWHFTMADSDNI